ncbi:MAG: hypothetical protein NTU97_02490 [Candidatus Magasanikbacteria bacterium]|nr:hypothetical protein [Candidatus Magasanikbacteria bacterium]
MKDFLKRFWIPMGLLLCLVVVGILMVTTAKEKPTCTNGMHEMATSFRYHMTNDSVSDLRYSLENFQKMEDCRLKFEAEGFHPNYTQKELQTWVKASAKRTMKTVQEMAGYNGIVDLMPEFNGLDQAMINYGLDWKDLGVNQYQLEQITKTWAKNQLRLKVTNLKEMRPENWLPGSLSNFDKSFEEVDKFRQEHNLSWNDGYASEEVLECLRGQFYAERARKLYESLRFYSLPQMDWQSKSPRHFAEAIYAATAKRGYCGYTAPTQVEVELATKMAYARTSEALLSDLRAKKYGFPASLQMVEELRGILKAGMIQPEELGTSEAELEDLSRKNPLGKCPGC